MDLDHERGLGFRDEGVCRVWGLRIRVWDLGFGS